MKAFILIALNGSSERTLLEQLKSYPEVRNAHVLFGEWDLIAEVAVQNAEQLGAFVMDRLRSNRDIKLTSSLIVAQ